jgi:seryl-tRNA synthetase
MKETKGKGDVAELRASQVVLKASVATMDAAEKEMAMNLKKMLWSVGNILEEDVPDGDDEHLHNKTVSEWGEIPDIKVDAKTPGCLHHN